jgi:DNA-binding XRE family transcriptional regulator
MYLTGEQMRGARAMLDWDQAELAQRANISLKTIKRMEATRGQIDARSNYSVIKAMELAGIEFLDREDFRGRAEGIRWRADRTAKLRQEIAHHVSRGLDSGLKYAVEEDEDLFERPTNEIIEIVFAKLKEEMSEALRFSLNKRDSLEQDSEVPSTSTPG